MTARLKIGDTCSKGHELVGDNVRNYKKNGYERIACKTCYNMHQRAYRSKAAPDKKDSAPFDRTAWYREYNQKRNLLKRIIADENAELDNMSIKDDGKTTAPWNYLKPKDASRDALEELDAALATGRTNCFNRPEDFMDFDDPRFPEESNPDAPRPIPTRDIRRILCEDCFAFDVCKNYAETARPDFGISAGEMWIGGKKV